MNSYFFCIILVLIYCNQAIPMLRSVSGMAVVSQQVQALRASNAARKFHNSPIASFRPGLNIGTGQIGFYLPMGGGGGNDACKDCKRKTTINNALKAISRKGCWLELHIPAPDPDSQEANQQVEVDKSIRDAFHLLDEAGFPMCCQLIPRKTWQERQKEMLENAERARQEEGGCIIL